MDPFEDQIIYNSEINLDDNPQKEPRKTENSYSKKKSENTFVKIIAEKNNIKKVKKAKIKKTLKKINNKKIGKKRIIPRKKSLIISDKILRKKNYFKKKFYLRINKKAQTRKKIKLKEDAGYNILNNGSTIPSLNNHIDNDIRQNEPTVNFNNSIANIIVDGYEEDNYFYENIIDVNTNQTDFYELKKDYYLG